MKEIKQVEEAKTKKNKNILINNSETKKIRHLINIPKRSNSINSNKISHFSNNNYNKERNNDLNIEYDNIYSNKILFKKGLKLR